MKLTIQQAQDLLQDAYRAIGEVVDSKYRLGQAIYNLLPRETAALVYQTENDFFYWTNNDRVVQTFYQYCVEN